jgi:hypothetical protein
MPQRSKLLAWIEPTNGDFLAAYVGGASVRPPAIRKCMSPDEGREWINGEASALGLPVEWLDHAKR